MALIDDVAAALGAAIGTYGREVLTKVGTAAGDSTAGLGLKLLGRLKRAKRPGLDEAVTDVAENPGDEDCRAALRVQLKKAVAADAELAADLERLVRSFPGAVAVTAAGERSIAAQTINGIASTGDHASYRIER